METNKILSLTKEIAELNNKVAQIQVEIQNKTKELEALVGAKETLAVENNQKEGRLIAIKFANGDAVYTYKTEILDFMQGEIVGVPRGTGLAMAAVIGVSNEPIYSNEEGFIKITRECDIQPSEISPTMKSDYKKLVTRMDNEEFFNIGIPAEVSENDRFAVSVKFLGSNSSTQEYTYLTDRNDYKKDDIVIVPTGAFNLPKRGIITGYVDFPKETDIEFKKVLCLLSEYNK